MKRAPYTELLTMEERAVGIKMGMAMELLDNGHSFKKQALTIPSAFDALKGAGGLALAMSLVAGAPLGYFAHHAGQKVKGETDVEKERLRRIQYYKDITRQLEHGLAGQPI